MAGVQNSVTLPQLAAKLRKMGPEISRAMQRGLVSGAHRIVAQVQEEIETTTPHKPVDQGTMAAGYRAIKTKKGAKVVNPVPQALWIERGRRPGPVSAQGQAHIAEWVRRKRIYLEELSRVLAEHKAGTIILKADKRGSVRKDAVREACERVAYAIAQKLRRQGYAPRWPLKRAIKASHRAVLQDVLQEMKKVSA